MAFGFFKKKQKQLEYDPSNITVRDLRKGFILDYDLRTWEVEQEYEYDWGNNSFSYEFKLVSADDTVFLAIEEDDHLECSVTRKVNFGRLDESVEEALLSRGKPPREVIFGGVMYYRESETPGYFRNLDSENWDEFISWDYYDESEKLVLTIEQWGDEEFEVSVGRTEEPEAFSNILPASS